MRFGRVDGFLQVGRDGELKLTVNLEFGRDFSVVRDEVVAPLRAIENDDDLRWHADQYTQETIAVHLAEQGWEVFAGSDAPSVESDGVIRSAGYLVRQL